MAHLLADDEITNTLSPCSLGSVDVRITDAWIYSEAEKKPGKKVSAVRYEWLLLWEAEDCYHIALCVGIATVGGANFVNRITESTSE